MTQLIEGNAILKVDGCGNLGEGVHRDVIGVCHAVHNIFNQDQVAIARQTGTAARNNPDSFRRHISQVFPFAGSVWDCR